MFSWLYSCFPFLSAVTSPEFSLSFHPNIGNDLIWYRSASKPDYQNLTNALSGFLSDYRRTESRADILKCDFDTDKPRGKECEVDIRYWYPCTPENDFNYPNLNPCVFIKLNGTNDWEPEYYDDPENLPQDMPADLKEFITSEKNQNPNRLKTVWLSCKGKNAADGENIDAIEYIPRRGFPGYYFPSSNSTQYLSPLVAIQIIKPIIGVIIHVECKVWAKNIQHDHQKQVGIVDFEILIG